MGKDTERAQSKLGLWPVVKDVQFPECPMPNKIQFALPVTSSDLIKIEEHFGDDSRFALTALIERQVAAEADEARRVALQMLDLADALGEFDPDGASHLLKGLLRFLAQDHALSVEATALRISGLAELSGGSLTLTPEGQQLVAALTGSGKGTLVQEAEMDGATSVDPSSTSNQPVAFAQMVFGDRTFEVADGPQEEKLIFRIKGTDLWHDLRNDRYAGWDVIGAEMLSLTSDTVADYIQMHTMRLQDHSLGENVHSFALDNVKWWICIEDGTAKFRIDAADPWQVIPEQISESSIRQLGIEAAKRMIPNFRTRIDADMKSWLRRMAHAAAVTPVISDAA